MIRRNPKQIGTSLWDCKPQTGLCPRRCNQCYYNRMGESHEDVRNAIVPSSNEVRSGIVRMNALHDSNLQKELVLKTAKQYKHVFFNTATPCFDFPGPVVYTANPDEEEDVLLLDELPPNLMFVRLRVYPRNRGKIAIGVHHYANLNLVPVVLTFMRYYSVEALNKVDVLPSDGGGSCYEKRKHVLNECWCPTKLFKRHVLQDMKKIGGRLVTMCGTIDSSLCKDCRNCELMYWQTLKHMSELPINKI